MSVVKPAPSTSLFELAQKLLILREKDLFIYRHVKALIDHACRSTGGK